MKRGRLGCGETRGESCGVGCGVGCAVFTTAAPAAARAPVEHTLSYATMMTQLRVNCGPTSSERNVSCMHADHKYLHIRHGMNMNALFTGCRRTPNSQPHSYSQPPAPRSHRPTYPIQEPAHERMLHPGSFAHPCSYHTHRTRLCTSDPLCCLPLMTLDGPLQAYSKPPLTSPRSSLVYPTVPM